eukprot:6623080-Prymnesium_polylepis.1
MDSTSELDESDLCLPEGRARPPMVSDCCCSRSSSTRSQHLPAQIRGHTGQRCCSTAPAITCGAGELK